MFKKKHFGQSPLKVSFKNSTLFKSVGDIMNNTSKSIILSLLLIFLVVSFSACSTQPQPIVEPSRTSYSASTQSFSHNGLSVKLSPVYGPQLQGTPTLDIHEIPEEAISVLVIFAPTAGDSGYNLFDSPKVISHMLDANPRKVDIPTGNLLEGRYRLRIEAFNANSETVAFIESYFTVVK